VNLGDFQDRRGNLLRDTVRYNWLIIAVFMVLGAAAGVGLSYAKPAKYTSSTTLLINPIVGNPYTPESNSDVLEMLQTEAVAVTSQETVDSVIEQLGIDLEPSRVRQQTRVSVPPNTQALQIAYTSNNRLLAPKIVKAIADTYLQDREDQAQAVIDNRVDRAQDELDQATDLYNEAVEGGHQGLANIHQAEVEAAQQSLANATALANDPGRVLTPGFIPASATKKHILIFTIAGTILGLIAGVGVGLLRERRRDLVRTAEDLDDYAFDAPVTAIHGHALDEDALRHLRMRLAPQIKDHGIVSLVGLAPGHALSTGVLLGTSLATGGTSVVLIDGTGTEPGHRDMLDFEGKPGLAQALTNHGPALPTAYKVTKNFGYLPAGPDADEAAEHLVEDRARTVVSGVAERYDLTFVACMPLDNAEGEALARLTAGVLLLVELNRTSHYELGMALKTIKAQERPLLGVFVLPASK
jgi:succinoglycan biosynthesis transport protein ExoP